MYIMVYHRYIGGEALQVQAHTLTTSLQTEIVIGRDKMVFRIQDTDWSRYNGYQNLAS